MNGQRVATQRTPAIYTASLQKSDSSLARGFGSPTRKITLGPSLSKNRQREVLRQDPLTMDPEPDQ